MKKTLIIIIIILVAIFAAPAMAFDFYNKIEATETIDTESAFWAGPFKAGTIISYIDCRKPNVGVVFRGGKGITSYRPMDWVVMQSAMSGKAVWLYMPLDMSGWYYLAAGNRPAN